MIKLFIGGFPLEITEMELAQLVGPYADILTIKIVRDRQTKKCKGYAFIEVVSEAQAAAAIDALQGVAMGDRELNLNIVAESEAKPQALVRYAKIARPSGTSDRNKRPRRPRL